MDHIMDYNDFCDLHDAEVCRRLERLPKCDKCGEPITSEDAYEVEPGEWWCEGCFEEWVKDIRKPTDELIEEDGW